MVSEAAKKKAAAKKASKATKVQGSAKPSPAVSQSPVSSIVIFLSQFVYLLVNDCLACELDAIVFTFQCKYHRSHMPGTYSYH